MKDRELKCVVAGSFQKAKPEIDTAIDELTDLGVTVLAPNKGWLYIPNRVYTLQSKNFRPLPSETHMSIKQIEDNFLSCVSQSDFVYLVNPNGYVGETVSMELGFAIAKQIPLYSRHQIDSGLNNNPLWKERINKSVKVMTPIEAIKDVYSSDEQD